VAYSNYQKAPSATSTDPHDWFRVTATFGLSALAAAVVAFVACGFAYFYNR